MNWQVVVRPQVRDDMVSAASWYESNRPGLGDEFIVEILAVFDELLLNPFLNSRQQVR